MKQLILVRHAKSSWSNPGLRDFDRPLNQRGLRDAPRMAYYLKSISVIPDIIISSSALRALTTAEYMAQELLQDPHQLISDRSLYASSAESLLSHVRSIDDGILRLMLVAHNPGISDLLGLLVEDAWEDMPTCAVALIDLDISGWNRVLPGTGQLQQLLYPKQLTD